MNAIKKWAKIILGFVGVVIFCFILNGLLTMGDNKSNDEASDSQSTGTSEDSEIKMIVGDDGKPVVIPADSVELAVEKNVIERQKPMGDYADAYECTGYTAEKLDEGEVAPVMARVGARVECKIHMTPKNSKIEDTFRQKGYVSGFATQDPRSVIIKMDK